MKAIKLIKIASFLYHNEYENPIRHKLYELTASKHPQDDITADLTKIFRKWLIGLGKFLKWRIGVKNGEDDIKEISQNKEGNARS